MKPHCINCERTDEKAPLLSLTFKGMVKHICSQCLPVLIHKPHLFEEELPGMEVAPSQEE
jgi:hypothetical protein